MNRLDDPRMLKKPSYSESKYLPQKHPFPSARHKCALEIERKRKMGEMHGALRNHPNSKTSYFPLYLNLISNVSKRPGRGFIERFVIILYTNSSCEMI